MEESLIYHNSGKTTESTPQKSPCSCPLLAHGLRRAKSSHAAEDVITPAAFISVFALLLLPYKKIDGNPVPTVVFNDLPSYFHAFVLGLNFAFCGGVMTISLRQLYPKVAFVCRCVSVLSMLLSTGIFVFLAVPWAADALL